VIIDADMETGRCLAIRRVSLQVPEVPEPTAAATKSDNLHEI